MSFIGFILRGLLRQRVRTVLTVVGIGIGITTVVALGAVASGLRAASGEMAHLGGADFMVAQKGAADLSFSTLTSRDLALVRRVEGVAGAWGALLLISRVGDNAFFLTFGVEKAEMPAVAPRLIRGRYPESGGEVALGVGAASQLGVDLGGGVQIERGTFVVVGVYESDAVWERNGAYAPLDRLQGLVGKPGVLTALFVRVAPGESPEIVADSVRASSDLLAVISNAEDYAQVDQGMEILDAGNLAISLLAVVIGAVGVMNTMIMSVFERTREIGVLRAVGWRRSRILRMIIGESIVLCVVAAVVGTLIGVGATRLVTLLPAIGPFLTPSYPVTLFVRALVIALAVALVGSLYPALRAIRFSPMEALRHE